MGTVGRETGATTAANTWSAVELRAFLILAEELHFGRAADRLGLDRSRVSQIIRTLEGRVGGRLFDRTSRRVELTPLGAHLVTNVQPGYDQLEHAFRDAREMATGISGTVRVGTYLAANLGRHWIRIVSEFERRHPTCRVEFVDTTIQRNYLDPLRSGELDMVVSRLPLQQPDLAIGPILSHERRMLMVAKQDPLASRKAVSIEDFADRLTDYPPELPREMVDAFIPPVSPSGRRLRRIPSTTVEQVLLGVARGELVHATVQSLIDHWAHPNCAAIPISDLPPSQTALVWVKANRSPKIEAFAHAAASVLGQTDLAAYQPTNGAITIPGSRRSFG